MVIIDETERLSTTTLEVLRDQHDRTHPAMIQYVVTGAAGFLGATLVEQLHARGDSVRALVRRPAPRLDALGAEVRLADVRHADELDAALADLGPDVVVLHAAGVVSIADTVRADVYATNVLGTQHVIDACRRHGVRRLVYVSSVHALPEPPAGTPVTEADTFDPTDRRGEYAQTKTEATRRVLAASDLDVVVVHPTGLIGPGDYTRGYVNDVVKAVVRGGLRVIVPGGYDMVDVRDVAAATLAAADRAPRGRTYLLSGHFTTIADLVRAVARLSGHSTRRLVLPFGVIRALIPLVGWVARLTGRDPLFTHNSMDVLRSNGVCDHSRATAELGYAPRPFAETLADTVAWFRRLRG